MNMPSNFYDYSTMNGKDRRTLNGVLRSARNVTMLSLIGSPRGTYDAECREPTNARIAAMLETVRFERFSVTGLRPAIRVLKAVMADIALEQPENYVRLGTTGMLCCRMVNGSPSVISNHAWGTAIDLTIGTAMEPSHNSDAMRGLQDIHPIFNRHGFFWGAAFRTGEAMHFEASDQLIRTWALAGEFGKVAARVPSGVMFGDRCTLVEQVQLILNGVLRPTFLTVDGIFGTETRAAIIEFQRRNALRPDGICGPSVLNALGISAGH